MKKATDETNAFRVVASRCGRIHVRVVGEVKEMLAQAVAMSTDPDVAAFVAGAAAERARLVLSDLEVTRIEDDNRRRFHDLVMSPLEPTDALKKLLASNAFRVVI